MKCRAENGDFSDAKICGTVATVASETDFVEMSGPRQPLAIGLADKMPLLDRATAVNFAQSKCLSPHLYPSRHNAIQNRVSSLRELALMKLQTEA